MVDAHLHFSKKRDFHFTGAVCSNRPFHRVFGTDELATDVAGRLCATVPGIAGGMVQLPSSLEA